MDKKELKPENVGSFIFVFHSHFPYVRKSGCWPFGEEWIYEGILETYLPLLEAIYNLKEKNIPAKISIGLTPVLLEQLSDPYMLAGFENYLSDRLSRAEMDSRRFENSGERELERLSVFYIEYFKRLQNLYFERLRRDIIKAFDLLQNEGVIEILTSAATHAYLPLLKRDSSIQAQIELAINTHKRYFHKKPRGIWLPECAYRPGYTYKSGDNEGYWKKGIDEFLIANGIEYFTTDSHAIEGGSAFWGGKMMGLYKETLPPRVDYSQKREATTYQPYLLKSGCVALGRNKETGLQVWSGDWGYPGDCNYREFHKKDSQSGLQYWKITGRDTDLGYKQLYSPENVVPRINENADHFNNLVEKLLDNYYSKNKEKGFILAPYDTELFGHWWFEGISWIENVIEKMYHNPYVQQQTMGEFIDSKPPQRVIELLESSWGNGGGHYVWHNPDTEWIWPYVHSSEEEMERIVESNPCADGLNQEFLNQAGRELLLMQSSDWPFLITTGQAKEYAKERFMEHYQNFKKLVSFIKNDSYDSRAQEFLKEISSKNNPFPDMDYRAFKRMEPEALEAMKAGV